jgi:histidine triad (HIT) family protein
MYNQNNVFSKIIKGEIPTQKLYEDDKLIAIEDINPAAPVHILVIPKGSYADFSDFVEKASCEDISHYFKTVKKIADQSGVKNYRLVSNKGKSAGQSVFHFHTHILGGKFNDHLIDRNL